MARNNNTTRPEDETTVGNTRAAQTDSKPASRGRNSSQRRDHNRRNKQKQSFNATHVATPPSTTEATTLGTNMNASGEMVFPMNAASIQAFGNIVTTPGQDNFATDFTVVGHGAGITDVPVNLYVDLNARKASNAMIIEFTPFFGSMEDDVTNAFVSPIRMAAVNLKQFIDTSFGTNTKYDPNDLMVYLMAVYAIFPLIAEIKRDLRLVYTVGHNQYPQFTPQGLMAALHLSNDAHAYTNGQAFEYLAIDLRSLIDQLNRVINMFNRLPIPPEMPIFTYHDYLLSTIFQDTEDVTTSQLYAFKLYSTWKYHATPVDKTRPGAYLEEIDLHEPKSVREKIQILADMVESISALRTSDTAMLQNLFNAYGSRDTLQVELLDYNTLQPVPQLYDERVLIMVENMHYCPTGAVKLSQVQSVVTDGTVCGHVVIPPGHVDMYFNLPLQFHKDFASITSEDIGWAMRMHPAFLNQHRYSTYSDAHPGGEMESRVTADQYTGFAIPRSVSIAKIGATSLIDEFIPSDRILNSTTGHAFYIESLHFKAAPMLVNFRVVTETSQLLEYALTEYTARKDVEVTYRLGDIRMYWTYLTETLWASTLNRNVRGTRTAG